MFSTRIVLSSAAAAAIVIGSHDIVDAFPSARAAAQRNPACSPNPIPVGPNTTKRSQQGQHSDSARVCEA